VDGQKAAIYHLSNVKQITTNASTKIGEQRGHELEGTGKPWSESCYCINNKKTFGYFTQVVIYGGNAVAYIVEAL
jgi:hypothetical protein